MRSTACVSQNDSDYADASCVIPISRHRDVQGGSPFGLDVDDVLDRVSGTVTAGCLDGDVLDIDSIIDAGELRDGLDTLVPVPSALGDAPNPVGGVIVLLSGDDRLDASSVLGDPSAPDDRLDPERLDDDRLDDDEANELVVGEIWPAANATDVSELDVLILGSQGGCGVGAGADGTVVVPDCIVPGA